MEEELQRALSAHGLTMVSSIPDKGRALFTTRDFSPGDAIICHEPYASAPSSTMCCDGCFAIHNLKRCSKCQIARYCGSTCQKSEWKLHQLECQALMSLREDRRKMLTPTILLMVRLLLKRKLQNDKAIPITATDNYDLIEALVSHISDIDEKQLVLYAQMANLIKLVLPDMEVNIKEVTENFSRLACNAHTICDSELRPLGTGIYPVISIINHSCLPNSVLVFEGRTAVVRAVEHIARGTEVSISYIETAATTMKRKKNLKEQYFFTCTCQRCNSDDICENLLEDAILEGNQCKDVRCNGALLHGSENKSLICQQCGFPRDRLEIEKIDIDVKQMSEIASKCLSEGNYQEARVLYINLEKLQLKLCHSFSLNLMKTREELLKILMEVKDWSGALTCCRLIIPAYERIYPATHPMLGLQYYICGKLEWLLGKTEEAVKSLTKAVDVLRITHGTSTSFMRDLLRKLEEARAEAAYSCRSSD